MTIALVWGRLAEATSADPFKSAIVAGMALVLAAAIPALLSRREREPRSVRQLREAQNALIIELTADRDECKRTLEQTVTGMQLRTKEIERLEKMLRHLGIDPETGQRQRQRRAPADDQ